MNQKLTFAPRNIVNIPGLHSERYDQITIHYSFGMLTTSRNYNTRHSLPYNIEIEVPATPTRRAHTFKFDGYCLSENDMWLLLSGIEEAAKNAIEAYLRRLQRDVDDLDLILNH